jgi:nitrite reductase/ring-hydroxylating ferredoxin subunit
MTALLGKNCAQPYGAYHSPRDLQPDAELTHVGRGTPAGELFRRYWQPVAYAEELTDVPRKLRVLGEDLVLFRTGGGEYGLVEQRCAHRGASLEYGVISERGIRCAYHGFHYAPDGAILETGAGAPLADGGKICLGAYPLQVFHGLIFAYMGPPGTQPAFPLLDLYDDPHITVEPCIERACELDCNWMQIVENAMDPVHAAYLHVLASGRQRGFSDQVGILPVLDWGQSETGMYYIACRRRPDDDLVWVRVVDRFMPNVGILPPNDDMRVDKPNISVRPFQWAWTVPLDDENTKRFYLLLNDDRNPLRPIQRTRGFGQVNDRPYEERRRQPGDYEMMASQGRIAVHAYENLTATDLGVIGYREMIRAGIEAVRAGRDPLGVVRDPQARIRTRTQNTLVRVPRAATPEADLELLRATGRLIAEGDELRAFPPV